MNICGRRCCKNRASGYGIICACIAMLTAALLPNKLIMAIILALLIMAWMCLF